jgi:hypothetical protein
MFDDETVIAALRACRARQAERILQGWFELRCVLDELDTSGAADRASLLRDLHKWLISKGGHFKSGPPDPWLGVEPSPGDVSYAWLPFDTWRALDSRHG